MKIKDYLFHILAGIACVVMVAVLIVLVFMNHKRSSERAAELTQRAQDIKQEEKAKLEAVSDIYDDMVSELGQRNIVCWGDNEMAGSETVSLPKALGTLIGEKLFVPVNEAFADLIELEDHTQPSLTVTNMGVSNEGMREILVRAGVNQLQVGEWTVIPADTEPKNLVLRDDTSWSRLHFAEQREARFGQAVISDVEGSLTVGEGEYDEDHPRFAFVRDEAGDSFAVSSGTEILTASAERFVGDIPVFFFEDDTAESVDGFVEDVGKLVDRYTDTGEEDSEENAEAGSTGAAAETAEETEPSEETEGVDDRQYVVICTAEEDSDLDAALAEAFGDHYIRNDLYAYEMDEEEYQKLAQRVYDKMDGMGCFDAAKKRTEKAVEDLDNLSVKIER